MANTLVQIDLTETLLPALALLTPAEAGLVAANPLGYTVLAGAESWQFSITVPEACVGIYRVEVRDGGGATVALGWVWIEADDTRTYVAEGSLARLITQRELEGVLKSGEERRISRAGKADIVYNSDSEYVYQFEYEGELSHYFTGASSSTTSRRLSDSSITIYLSRSSVTSPSGRPVAATRGWCRIHPMGASLRWSSRPIRKNLLALRSTAT